MRLPIEGMYDGDMAVSRENLETLPELSGKYNVLDIRRKCSRMLEHVQLTLQSLPRVLWLAATYDLAAVPARFQCAIAQNDAFTQLCR